MSELVVSYLIRNQHSAPYGFRVYENGQVEAYQSARFVKSTAGDIRQEEIKPDWYALKTLGEGDLKAVKRVIREAGLTTMPDEIDDAGEDNTSDTSSAEWQVGTENGVRTINVHHWVPASARGDVLLDLESEITDIINDAE